MPALWLTCPRCREASPPNTRYCAHCGEPLDPSLVKELRGLEWTLADLDARIAADKGGQTIVELRNEYYTRYHESILAPWLRGTAARNQSASVGVADAPAGRPSVSEAFPIVSAGESVSAAPAPVIPPPSPLPRTTTPIPAVTLPPSPTMPPPGPVFSWRAFAAEQAIAIMAYLGGFLALVATLTLVVSKGANLPTLTLSIVCLVYLAFGASGLSLRNITRMRTVSQTYLAVFALMTPLVALALYRYELEQFNVPAAGMLCISAVYATIVYLALAVQTRFATYAYLGWTALIVAALAIIPWWNLYIQWWVFILGVTTLALIAPFYARHVPLVSILAESAIQLAALATIPVVIGVQVFGTIGLSQLVNPYAFPTIFIDPAGLALAACILVPITAAWRSTVPAWRPRQQNAVIDTIDGFNAVFFAEAVGGVALWIGADNRGMADVLATLALVECGLALALYLRQPQRRALRYFLEALAVGLASGGAFIVLGDGDPNWPLMAALSAALLVTVGAALIDGVWWLLLSGFFLTLDYYALAPALFSTGFIADNRAAFSFALTLALWTAALALGANPRTRRLIVPVYLVALGNALFTCLLLSGHDAGYQTGILLTFTAAAFSAGLREREPMIGNLATGFFGALAVFPFITNDTNGLHAAALAVGLALATVAVRRVWGRTWTLALYVVVLWAVIEAAAHAQASGVSVPDWSGGGLSFTSMFLLVFVALAFDVAFWEGEPLATIIPAALAFWALLLFTSDLASVILVFGLLAIGAAARQWRGRLWGSAVEVAAVGGSVVVATRLNDLGFSAPYWQAAFLLALAVVAYLIAVQERVPALTVVAVSYALAAAILLPGQDNFTVTLVLTFAFVALGAILRLPMLRERVRPAWALAPYAAAIGCSILATQRITPFDPNQAGYLLLAFAVVAYMLVALEGQPQAALVPLCYALAGIFVLPDTHLLLAISLSVLGMIVGRVAGPRWSWTFYVAASASAAAAIFIGNGNDPAAFATGALILAVLAYVIAAVESRPDVILVALGLGLSSLVEEAIALNMPLWEATLAFVALGWLYLLSAALWRAIPWLRPRGGAWWVDAINLAQQARWSDPRLVGTLVHLASGFLVTTGAALVAIFAPNGFAIQDAQTLAASLALLALAGMLLVLSWCLRHLFGFSPRSWLHLTPYLARELVALSITWGARWLGADNPQAFILAPGSYQLIVGAFLPADRRLPYAQRLGQFASLTGALLLLLPTLYQTYTEPSLTFQLVYGLVVLLEALVIVGLGVGIHSRLLVLVGSAFVGVDALGGVRLALQSGVPIPLVVGSVALVLIGVATWLSLRPRRDTA
jgi:hypothetical protein